MYWFSAKWSPRHHVDWTRYDPAARNEQGHYQKIDWTSASDIGAVFEDGLLTWDEYMRIERAYADAAEAFMLASAVSTLTVLDLELNPGRHCILNLQYFRDPFQEKAFQLVNGMKISVEQVKQLARLCLREIVWCRLEHPGKFFLHFGYDLYMYVGSHLPCRDMTEQLHKSSLFLEQLPSPYQNS